MDNARPHSAARTQDYLKGTGATILSQSAYSPDLKLCNRFLFSHLQQHCKGLEYLDGDELYRGTCLLKASNILLYYFVSIKSLLSTTLLVQHYLRQLPEDLMKHEVEKMLIHCRAVIREGGGYVTFVSRRARR